MPPDETERIDVEANEKLVSAVVELATLPAALLAGHASRLAAHLDHSMPDVRKNCLRCLAKLSTEQLEPHASRLVGRLADEDGFIAFLAIEVATRLMPSMCTGAAWAHLLTVLGTIVMRDEAAVVLVGTSFALDVLFALDGGANPAELAQRFDIGRLKRALDEDAKETRSWRNKQRWEIKEPPWRFLHRSPTWQTDDIAWGLTGSGVALVDVLKSYDAWRTAAQARTDAAFIEQMSIVFQSWLNDTAGSGGSSSVDTGHIPVANTGLGRPPAPSMLSQAAVQSIVANISTLPAEAISLRLGDALRFIAEGTDPELLVAAVHAVLKCEPSRLLDHVCAQCHGRHPTPRVCSFGIHVLLRPPALCTFTHMRTATRHVVPALAPHWLASMWCA